MPPRADWRDKAPDVHAGTTANTTRSLGPAASTSA